MRAFPRCSNAFWYFPSWQKHEHRKLYIYSESFLDVTDTYSKCHSYLVMLVACAHIISQKRLLLLKKIDLPVKTADQELSGVQYFLKRIWVEKETSRMKNVTSFLPVITFNACSYSKANIVDIQGICWFNQGLIQHNAGVLIMTRGGDDVALRKKVREERRQR